MILDSGIVKIYRVDGRERAEKSPVSGLPAVYSNWAGRLKGDSATNGIKTARLRIHEAGVEENDIASFGGANWIVQRVYHGSDDDNGLPIADITMQTGEKLFERINLISAVHHGDRVNEHGFYNPPEEQSRGVWCMQRDAANEEFFESNAEGVRSVIRIDVYACEYRGEMLAEYKGRRYAVTKTHAGSGTLIELTLDNASEGGSADGKV